MSGLRYIGGSIPRLDGPDKARGRYDYLADMVSDGVLHGAILFSDRAHALVKSIDVSKIDGMKGVSVLTFHDAPETLYNSGEWFPGQNDHPDERVLTGHVRHVGDRIAIVLAPDGHLAREARERIVVDYEDLEPLVDLSRAEKMASLLHDDGHASFPGLIEYGDVDAAFETAAHVVSDRVRTQKIHHAAMEPHAVLAVPRPENVIEIHTPCQIAFGVQHAAAQVLPIPLSKIRVVKTPMGGSFGGKQEVVFETLCAWAAYRTGRPVFIATSREETMLATRTRFLSDSVVESAIDEEGRILGRRFSVVADAGAYMSGTRKAMMAMGKKISRLYKIPAMRFEGRVVRTSTTPAGACRGYGSPQSHTVTEIHTDLLCRRLGMDPAGFRMKNLVDPFMDDPTGASNIGNARIKDCLTRGLAAFDWDNRKAPSASGRFRRGAGFACCTHGNGYQGTIYHDMSQMSLRILEDGSIILRSGIHELGHAAIATIAQIVAEETGVPPERIAVLEADSQFGHYDIGCQASRGIYVCGECARLCARKAVELLCEQAEILWNLPTGSVALDKSGEPALLAGDRAIAIGEAVSAIEMKNRVPIDVIFLHRPESNPGSYGAHFADVTVDTLTGLVRVNKYLAVHDVGRVLNRSFIKGQIYGGVQMGLGMALTEELSFDKNGAPSARNFDKYHLVNAPDMPDVEVLLIEDVEKGGPFGAKSIGEIAAVPVAPAVVNAVNRALSTELTDLPLTPSKIVRALKETGVS